MLPSFSHSGSTAREGAAGYSSSRGPSSKTGTYAAASKSVTLHGMRACPRVGAGLYTWERSGSACRAWDRSQGSRQQQVSATTSPTTTSLSLTPPQRRSPPQQQQPSPASRRGDNEQPALEAQMPHLHASSHGQESIRRLLDRGYRSQVETFQRLLTQETVGQLQDELTPAERQQLQTIIEDIEYLRYLPSGDGAADEEASDAAYSSAERTQLLHGAAGQQQASSMEHLRDFQDAKLAVQRLPPDLISYIASMFEGAGERQLSSLLSMVGESQLATMDSLYQDILAFRDCSSEDLPNKYVEISRKMEQLQAELSQVAVEPHPGASSSAAGDMPASLDDGDERGVGLGADVDAVNQDGRSRLSDRALHQEALGLDLGSVGPGRPGLGDIGRLQGEGQESGGQHPLGAAVTVQEEEPLASSDFDEQFANLGLELLSLDVEDEDDQGEQAPPTYQEEPARKRFLQGAKPVKVARRGRLFSRPEYEDA